MDTPETPTSQENTGAACVISGNSGLALGVLLQEAHNSGVLSYTGTLSKTSYVCGAIAVVAGAVLYIINHCKTKEEVSKL